MYKNYSDKDLIETYNTMLDYSNKPSNDMLSEIEKRGGLENFKIIIKNDLSLKEEYNRIAKEVNGIYTSDTEIDFIKKFISSNLLNKEELDKVIEIKYLERKKIFYNITITSKTVFGSLIGALVGMVIGAIVWVLLMWFVSPMLFVPYLIILYLINYLAIRFITKQTASNLMVFIASFIATILALFLGIYLLELLQTNN